MTILRVGTNETVLEQLGLHFWGQEKDDQESDGEEVHQEEECKEKEVCQEEKVTASHLHLSPLCALGRCMMSVTRPESLRSLGHGRLG